MGIVYDETKVAIRPKTKIEVANNNSGAKPTPMETAIWSAIKLLEKHIERLEAQAKKKKQR